MRAASLLGPLAAVALPVLLASCVSGPHAANLVHATATSTHAGTTRVLFDDTKAETAGNADWIVSTAMPDPRAENRQPSSETDWTGALSAWGVSLQQAGSYLLATLPPSGRITYGDSANPQDLSHYDVFVLPEPNVLFTAAQKTAILSFVENGGGLFMISDHTGSDRNDDGADSVEVLNDLMGSDDPFGFSIDSADIPSDDPDVLGSSDEILDGPFGPVAGTVIRDGTTATLHPADNSAVKGELFRTGASASDTLGAAVASSQYGFGRVVFWGDSSALDDGTGQSGNTLYDGWDDAGGSDGVLALNATAWLGARSQT
jgi:hypothetical protein